jgi:hypothetical protein
MEVALIYRHRYTIKLTFKKLTQIWCTPIAYLLLNTLKINNIKIQTVCFFELVGKQ